ncbi:hypothetical protein H4Q26_002615 [Puccinia striiformis f. sp. tritici PST-130]|nr:hypothetical protein H4Q26_002615 [Puccinia striiformis f. sp. tritici PST-130]
MSSRHLAVCKLVGNFLRSLSSGWRTVETNPIGARSPEPFANRLVTSWKHPKYTFYYGPSRDPISCQLFDPTVARTRPTIFCLFAIHSKAQRTIYPRHWNPLEPERGSGYRAVSFDPSRQDGYLDPVLSILAQLVGTSNRDLRRSILQNFTVAQGAGWTLWTDPGCVSIRVQASGGELKELFGNLPVHLLSRPRIGIPSPPSVSTSTTLASRLLASLPANLEPYPSSPQPESPDSQSRHLRHSHPASLQHAPKDSDGEDEQTRCQEMLAEQFQTQFKLSSYASNTEDSYFRPSSRTSSHRPPPVSPLGMILKKKLSTHQLPQNSARSQLSTGYIRHHSSNSVPYASMNTMSLTPMAPVQQQQQQQHHPAQHPQHIRSTTSSRIQCLSLECEWRPRASRTEEGPGTVTEHSVGKSESWAEAFFSGLPKDKEAGSGSANNSGNRRASARRTRTGPAKA